MTSTALPPVFPVHVHMLSDWIVGTGEGRTGAVDATVRRDSDGLPFIPAKTLTGIWRDACEQVSAWFGGSDAAANPWPDWVDWIFGSQPDVTGDRTASAHQAPRPAALALSPARLPLPVRDACRYRPALQAAAVLLRPGVAIDHETGVASDDMLRLEERARPGELESLAEFTTPDGSDLPAAAELLLRAGAAVVDGLGGKRNRGAGRCWLLLPGMTGLDEAAAPAAPRPADACLAVLAADTALLDDPGLPPSHGRSAVRLLTSGTPSILNEPSDATAVPGARTIHRVTCEVITPLVAQHRVLGNVVLSRESVPGSLLLPDILSRLNEPVGHRDLAVGDARPAVMTDHGAVPGQPAPMIWYRPKDRHRRDLVNAAERRPGPAERRKPMRTGHIVPTGPGQWRLVDTEMTVSAHAVVDDDAGRPTTSGGGVFSYVGLASGTVLVSDVVLPTGVHLKLTAGERLRLGRSRKDDFGQVIVRDVAVVPAAAADAVQAGAAVRAWCVSDVLLRDDWGAPDPSPQALAHELTQRFGVTVHVAASEAGGPVVQAHRAARRESFHTRWGRPRPSLIGLAAGSVVTVQFDGAVPAKTLAAVQRDGVGERTAEGFGQVLFDAPEVMTSQPTLVTLPADQAQASAPPGGADGAGMPPVPAPMERAAVEAEIRRQVANAVVDGADRIVPGAARVTSRAQWGSLRQQLPRLNTPGGREAVARWFDQTRNVRQRRTTWGEPTLDALQHLVTDASAVWTALDMDGASLDGFVLAPERADAVRASLWAHAVTVLVTEISRDATRQLQAASTDGGN